MPLQGAAQRVNAIMSTMAGARYPVRTQPWWHPWIAVFVLAGVVMVGAGWWAFERSQPDQQVVLDVRRSAPLPVQVSDTDIRAEAHQACAWLAAQPAARQLGAGQAADPALSPQAMEDRYLRQKQASPLPAQARATTVTFAWLYMCSDDRATRTQHYAEPGQND